MPLCQRAALKNFVPNIRKPANCKHEATVKFLMAGDVSDMMCIISVARWASLRRKSVQGVSRGVPLSRCPIGNPGQPATHNLWIVCTNNFAYMLQARITKADLSAEAAEAGVRAVASMSAIKACEVLHAHVIGKGIEPCSKTTLPLLFRELKGSGDASAFEELIAAVEPGLLQASGAATGDDQASEGAAGSLQEQQDAMRCLNMMLRQLAPLDIKAAVSRVKSYHKQGIIIEGATYSQLAAASLTAGDFPQAEMMLEMRDYL